jgi:fatty-acyl-CoA synthase
MLDITPETTLGALPSMAAVRWGERDALLFKGSTFTFNEVDEAVNRTAKGLMALGVEPGDKVAIWLTNCPEWMWLMFALAKIGAIQVPVNTRFRTADLEYVLRQADCRMLITHDVSGPIDYMAMVRELVPEMGPGLNGRMTETIASAAFPELRQVILKTETPCPGTTLFGRLSELAADVSDAQLQARAAAVRPDDIFFIMYTSGTTGFPKGVMRNHALLRNHVDRIQALDVTEADVMLNYLPLFHIFGYSDGPLMSMYAGNRQVLVESFDAQAAMDLVEREGISILCGFETHLKELSDAQESRPRDISSLRAGVFAAGMNSSVPIVHRAATVLAPLRTLTAYGMTEIGANAALSPFDASLEQRAETSGLPCPGFEYRIIDPDSGQDQPTNTPGEILVKSYNLMQGYYKKPAETAAIYDAQGWFRTGDMGYLRDDGYLRFLGRYKDMLKVGGENVDPMEVEAYLLEHPKLRQAAVVSYPDKRLTEVPVAFVIANSADAPDGEEIISYCKGKIASFKIPRHVFVLDELPMTSTGKIQKVYLRERAIEALGVTQ